MIAKLDAGKGAHKPPYVLPLGSPIRLMAINTRLCL